MKLRCVCGEEHEVDSFLDGTAVLVCPTAPPGMMFLLNQKYMNQIVEPRIVVDPRKTP